MRVLWESRHNTEQYRNNLSENSVIWIYQIKNGEQSSSKLLILDDIVPSFVLVGYRISVFGLEWIMCLLCRHFSSPKSCQCCSTYILVGCWYSVRRFVAKCLAIRSVSKPKHWAKMLNVRLSMIIKPQEYMLLSSPFCYIAFWRIACILYFRQTELTVVLYHRDISVMAA